MPSYVWLGNKKGEGGEQCDLVPSKVNWNNFIINSIENIFGNSYSFCEDKVNNQYNNLGDCLYLLFVW